ncbi:hypothetical protein LVB87_12665 [Lysobacter sp. KIS68-7]|uniref:hypothetical protein n=1 Tax=Lysobacter sp. KIS68-7 TaxID=2904252 RepID=UPI001E39045D|nr:hypothetical protein [Lysobacter sp. KIS68-7]UHQ19026.1 hypothetical protein LVB87_12665 [Lysobacter sp. KIS68-7]
MDTTMHLRQRLMFVNSVFLGMFAVVSFFMLDIRGIWFGAGPLSHVVGAQPVSGLGFLEAHGLAAILAFWFLRVSRTPPERAWHFTASAVHTLLGSANIALWHIFTVGDAMVLGYVSTGMHIVFAVLQLFAGLRAGRA